MCDITTKIQKSAPQKQQTHNRRHEQNFEGAGLTEGSSDKSEEQEFSGVSQCTGLASEGERTGL